jgi:hypothetical protein
VGSLFDGAPPLTSVREFAAASMSCGTGQHTLRSKQQTCDIRSGNASQLGRVADEADLELGSHGGDITPQPARLDIIS